MTFKELNITEPILKAIEEKGYTVCLLYTSDAADD